MKKSMVKTAVLSLFLALSPLSAGAQTAVSVGADGDFGNDASGHETLSLDGRYVVFYSRASNLVPGDTNNAGDIFVYDNQSGALERVSVDSYGNEADGESTWPSISADGRLVAFMSKAANLAPGYGHPMGIYMHDRATGITDVVDLSSHNIIPQNTPHAFWFRLSDDGSTLLLSYENLAITAGLVNTLPDTVIVDIAADTIDGLPVSPDAYEVVGGRISGSMPRNPMSSDGNRIVFQATERYLDRKGKVTAPVVKLRVYDRAAGTVYDLSALNSYTNTAISADGNWVALSDDNNNLVVKSCDGSQKETIRFKNGTPYVLTLSETGRFVTVGNDRDGDNVYQEEIYDRDTGTWQPVGTAEARVGEYGYFDLSPNTRYAAYSLGEVINSVSVWQVYVYDRWIDFPPTEATQATAPATSTEPAPVKGGGKNK